MKKIEAVIFDVDNTLYDFTDFYNPAMEALISGISKKSGVSKDRSGPTSSDKLAAKLSYTWLVDVMPLVSHIQGHAPEYEKQYKLHLASVH
jgi:phosphoglycolate phosphatase-like HAD superfamily hydrolase